MTMKEIRALLDAYTDEIEAHHHLGEPPGCSPAEAAEANVKIAARRSALLQRVEALREERDLYRRQVEVRYGKAEEQIERLAAERDAALAAQKRAEEERDEAPAFPASAPRETTDLLPDFKALVAACRGIISLSNPDDFVSNGEWRRAVADLRAVLAPASAPSKGSGEARCPSCGSIADLNQRLGGRYATCRMATCSKTFPVPAPSPTSTDPGAEVKS